VSKSDNLIDGATAIVSALGLAVADTAIGGAGSLLSGTAALNNFRKRVMGKAPDIHARVVSELDAALKSPTVHMPADGPQLLPQMFERIRLTPQQVMAAQRNPNRLCLAMLESVVLIDTANRPDLHNAFKGILTPILARLLDDPQVGDALRPIYETAVAETLEYIAAQVTVLNEQFKDTAEELGLTKGLLLSLARQTAPEVENPLDAHAEIQNRLEIAKSMNDRGALPSNIPDAVDAIMEEVRALNDQGQIAEGLARLTRARAEQKDRRDREAQAYLTLLAEEESQAILARDAGAVAAAIVARVEEAHSDPDARFRALRAVQDEWYERGRDKGLGFDLEVSIALAEATHARARTADQRGTAQNDLGAALQTLGERESDTVRLEHSVASYQAALEEHTRDRVPRQWAATQMNLGTALQTLGQRESGTARLEQSVAAFQVALEEYTRDRVPLDWAMTQMNLGNALATIGERESGTDRLEQAVVAYQAALEERTRDCVPLQWAMTQNNLGNALQTLGQRESGTDRLEQSVAAYEAALEERTRDRVPLYWALTQFNLAAVHLAFFDKTADPDHLTRAEGHATAAREVFAEAGASHYLAMADRQLADIAARRAASGT